MPNRLAAEPSPYLQQHAENPVDWYPWGEEAFEAARQSDRPLFVSIGYATCHWCHVMERESFEDEGIAALMNEAFVNVKVDREERPDVDGIYMMVCQILTGQGGWPLNVVLTPDRKPIFAGTYIPPTSVHGRIGMRELVPRLRQIWTSERERMETSASEITQLLQQEAEGDLRSTPDDAAVLNDAALLLERQYDPAYHGFGQAPKFPMPHYIGLLLRHWKETGSSRSLEMASATLKSMARGGMFDHVGFGFHRYSTDAKWLVPHFEKMLYDQAQLLDAYVEGYLATREEEFAVTARAVAQYVARDLRASTGGFFSAEDADSEGEEGRFYVWSLDEFSGALDESGVDLGFAIREFNVTKEGNYFDEATQLRTGKNILHRSATANLVDNDGEDRLTIIRERLFESRSHRVRPLLDDKILTDWNGLMIRSLARAGAALGDQEMISLAVSAAGFIDEHLRDEGGRLLHRFRNGKAGVRAKLDDYVFLASGCLELFFVSGRSHWLKQSVELTEATIEDFWDGTNGGFFVASEDETDLIVRRKEIQDGAIPSGLSAAVSNLARLGRLLRRPEFSECALAAIRSVGRSLSRYPTAHTALISAAGDHRDDAGEIVIVGARSDPSTYAMMAAAHEGFHPHRLVILLDAEIDQSELFEMAPHFKDYRSVGGRPTAYVCTDFVCQAPTMELDELKRQLSGG